MARIHRVLHVPEKRAFAVHARASPEQQAELTAVGTGPWTTVKVVPRRQASRMPAVKEGRRIVEQINAERIRNNQKPLDLSEWGGASKIGIRGIRTNRHRMRIEVEPRGYGEFAAGREEFSRLSAREREALFLNESFNRNSSLLKRTPHLLAAGNVLLIGEKWVLIPRLSQRNKANPERFHVFAGLGEAHLKQFYRSKQFSPLETARRELTEETGIPSQKVEFLREKLRPNRSRKNLALATARSTEGLSPGLDIIFAVRARTGKPEKFLRTYFKQNSVGEWVPKKALDAWETMGSALIPQSSEGIRLFLENNSNQITSVALIALKALQIELEKNGKIR